jgi:hypothetical protein
MPCYGFRGSAVVVKIPSTPGLSAIRTFRGYFQIGGDSLITWSVRPGRVARFAPVLLTRRRRRLSKGARDLDENVFVAFAAPFRTRAEPRGRSY